MLCEHYYNKLSEQVKEIKIVMFTTFQHELTPSILSYGFCLIVFSLTFKLLNTYTLCNFIGMCPWSKVIWEGVKKWMFSGSYILIVKALFSENFGLI